MTLIEVMIALLLLAIVAMATMKTALLVMRVNMQNTLRDEAVNVADAKMAELREWPYNSIVTNATESTVARQFRNGFTVNYTPHVDAVQEIESNTAKLVTLSVGWTFSGQTYTHRITTIVRNQE